jgi:Concanavalin A-like lectin/glucanases superfamily
MGRGGGAPRWWRAARRCRLPAALGTTVLASATLATGGLAWASLGGAVADSAGAFSTGTMLLGGTTPSGVTCTSSSTVAPIVSNSATCPGDPLPAKTLTTVPSAAATTLSDPGTTSATATTIAAPSCGVEQLADSESHDTGLAMGGVSYGQAGPLSGTGTGIAFDGSSGWFESTSSYASPSSFTLLAWFEASPGATGTIFSVSNAQFDSGATSSDLNLWVNSTGKLVWGVVTLGALGAQVPSEITSSSTVTDGNWHLAAATFSGMSSTLYLDGTSEGSVLSITGVGSTTGYPSIGWGPEASTGWSGAPSSAFFGGTLSMVSLSPSAAPAAQIATLAGESTASAYESALGSAAAPSENWQMADSGTTPFTGAVAVSGGGTTVPCQRVEVTVQQLQGATTGCAFPAVAGPCPAPANTSLLSTLSAATALAVPSPAAPVQITLTCALTAPSPLGVAGLDLLPGFAFDAARQSWTAALDYQGASVGL